MSLRVWLPLNGSLDNQGLENVTVTVNGTTSYTSGKIGQCLSCNGSSFWNIVGLTLGAEATIAYWSKTTVASKMSWVLLSTASDKLNLYESGIYTLNIGDSNNNPFKDSNGNTISVLNDGEWHHFAIVFSTTKVKLYIDGEYRGTSVTYRVPTTTSAKTIRMGGGYNNAHSYDWNGGLNDFRVYDHALSEQEIKKIAQGLIVHYPLNKNGWGQDNILTNTHFDSRYSQTTGWNTTKNGTQMASSWGGYNSGVTNASSVYHAHLKEVGSEYVYEFIKTADESWLGISQGGLNTKLTSGVTYTFSWEEYHVDGVNRVGTGLYYYKQGASSANFHLGIQQASNVTREIGRWQKFSYTFVAPSDGDYTKSMAWYVYGHYNGNGTFYVRHLKLEEGSVPTAWCPNVSDNLYSSLNVNNNIMYDISGFGNNGTIHGTFSYITDTPLYKISTSVIGSGSDYLEGIVLPVEAKTVSLWAKCAKSVSSAIFNDKTTGLQIGLLNSLIYINSKSSTAGFTTSHWINNDWNHVVVINDNGTRRCYVNGQPETQSGSSNYYIHNANNFWVWNRSYNNSYPYKGALSDLRIYATALSADEVKELYEHRNNI